MLDKILNAPKYKEYNSLRSYILMRDSCYNKNSELIDVKIYDEIIQRYIKTYEETSGKFLRGNYIDYKNIINSRLEEVVFESKREDKINVVLRCHANTLELNLLVEPTPKKADQSIFTITTILGEYNIPETYCVQIVEPTTYGKIISNESDALIEKIGENIVAYDKAIFGTGMFPN